MSDSESHEVNVISDNEENDSGARDDNSDSDAPDGLCTSKDSGARDDNSDSDAPDGLRTSKDSGARDDKKYVSIEEFNAFKRKVDIEIASLKKTIEEFNSSKKSPSSSPAPQIDIDPIVIEHIKNKIILSGNTEKYKTDILKLGYKWNEELESYIITTTDSFKTISDIKNALGTVVKIDDKCQAKPKTLVLKGVSSFKGDKPPVNKGGNITIEFYKNSVKASGDTRDAKEFFKDNGWKWNTTMKCWLAFKKDREFLDYIVRELRNIANVEDKTVDG